MNPDDDTMRRPGLVVLGFGLFLVAILAVAGIMAPQPKTYVPPADKVPALEARLDAAQGDIARLQLQVADLTTQLHALQVRPQGLSGPEVRALIDETKAPTLLCPADPAQPCTEVVDDGAQP